MTTCPNCAEEWPSTSSVCSCGASLDSVERAEHANRAGRRDGVGAGGRSGPSTLQVVIAVIVVLALVPSVVILARAMSSGEGAPSAMDGPSDLPEVQPDRLPDGRELPSIACAGQDVADDCVTWVFTLPGDTLNDYRVNITDTQVAVRTREDVWLLDPATGEQRWHHQESAGDSDALSVWLAGGMVVLEAPDGFQTLDGATGEPAASVTLEDEFLWASADDQRVFTATQSDDVTIQGWDPASGDLLWTTRLDTPWEPIAVHVDASMPGRLTVRTVREPTTDGSEGQHTTLDTSTGRAVDDQTPEDILLENPAFRVRLNGTRLWAGRGFNEIEWQRELDQPFRATFAVSTDHVALHGADDHQLIIDARTGDDVAHVRIANGLIRYHRIWRPWPEAPGLMMQVQTSDAQHLVLVGLPLN